MSKLCINTPTVFFNVIIYIINFIVPDWTRFKEQTEIQICLFAAVSLPSFDFRFSDTD